MGQVMNKLKKGDPTPEQVGRLDKEMERIIGNVYDTDLNKKVGYDDFYHAIFKIIQELRKEAGAMQYNLPSKEELDKAFTKFHKSNGPLTKSECSDIIKSLITVERFSVGQGAMDILLYLFGFPICAVMAKRIIPGMRSISDDVVIPLATSGSVIFLAKTHKL